MRFQSLIALLALAAQAAVPPVSFQAPRVYPLGHLSSFPVQVVAVGDFNHDGIPDLAVAVEESNTVSVLLGYAVGYWPTCIAAGDLKATASRTWRHATMPAASGCCSTTPNNLVIAARRGRVHCRNYSVEIQPHNAPRRVGKHDDCDSPTLHVLLIPNVPVSRAGYAGGRAVIKQNAHRWMRK